MNDSQKTCSVELKKQAQVEGRTEKKGLKRTRTKEFEIEIHSTFVLLSRLFRVLKPVNCYEFISFAFSFAAFFIT